MGYGTYTSAPKTELSTRGLILVIDAPCNPHYLLWISEARDKIRVHHMHNDSYL